MGNGNPEPAGVGPGTQITESLQPTLPDCYGHAWKKLWKNILMILLIEALIIGLTLPQMIPFGIGFVYGILVGWPVAYGCAYVALKAARGEEFTVGDLFQAFKTYGHTLLAVLLTSLIFIGGLILLIVPGIIFMCKLAFVPYLVVEKKMGAIEAIGKSWEMTKGYTGTIFLMGLLTIPIALAGLLACCVGVIPAGWWIAIAFGSLYEAVVKKQAAGTP